MSKKPKPIEPGNYNGIRVTSICNPLTDLLKPLDFFMVKGQDLVSWGIRMVERDQSTDREAEYNHAGILPNGNQCSLEALWTLTSTNIFEHYEGCKILIARWNKMTNEHAIHALNETNKHISAIYPIHRLLLHFLHMAHIFHWSGALVCSEYVAKVLYKAGARHPHFFGTTPDNLADEVHNQLNSERTGPKYSIIYEKELPFNYYYYCQLCKTFYLIPALNTLYCPTCHIRSLTYLHWISGSINFELNKKIYKYNKEKDLWASKFIQSY